MKRNGSAPASRANAARRHGSGNGQLAEQAAEIAVQLECVKLTEEELPLGVAYTRFLDLVQRAIPFEYGTLYVTEWESGRLIPVAIRGTQVDLAEQVRFARGSGVSAWVAQERRPVVIPDPAQHGEPSPIANGTVRAYLAFPLVQNGVVAGVVALARTDQTFSTSEFARLGRLADPLVTTLSRLRREARLRELLYIDAQTGLSNHIHFQARIEEELQRVQQHAGEFTVAVLELEGIEAISHLHGRQAGARLVQTFTQRLQSSMRTCDMAASLEDGRYGLLFAGVNEETAAAIIQRIAAAVLGDNLEIPLEQVPLRLQAGVASHAEIDGSIEDLLRQLTHRLAYVA